MANIKHGHWKNGRATPEYSTWLSMKNRCNNPKYKHYYNYGGRGISVCLRWNDFRNFLKDMGKKPIGYSIDRIDNNGNYEPNNCRWATAKEQRLNRRDYKEYTYNNISKTLIEWCKIFNVTHGAIIYHLKKGVPFQQIGERYYGS